MGQAVDGRGPLGHQTRQPILNMLGIETDDSIRNNAAYIQSWIKALRNDKKLIVSAASKAGKAVELIMPEMA